MSQGRAKKWITAKIIEPLNLGNSGIRIVIWDKWGKTRRGTAEISVGGIRWRGFKKQNKFRISWDALEEKLTKKTRT